MNPETRSNVPVLYYMDEINTKRAIGLSHIYLGFQTHRYAKELYYFVRITDFIIHILGDFLSPIRSNDKKNVVRLFSY